MMHFIICQNVKQQILSILPFRLIPPIPSTRLPYPRVKEKEKEKEKEEKKKKKPPSSPNSPSPPPTPAPHHGPPIFKKLASVLSTTTTTPTT